MLKVKSYDLLIIGSGIAGFSAALAAADNGLDVALICKDKNVDQSNSWWAQGGIVSCGPGDSPQTLAKDIIRVGDSLNNIRAVELVACEGSSLLTEYLIKRAKISFDSSPDGSFDWTKEAGHSLRRILHVKDQTGKAIQEGLFNLIQSKENIHFYPDRIAVDIITNTHHSCNSQQRYRKTQALGAYTMKDGQIFPMFAPAVLLATGGIGNLYLHSTNPPSATGDGIAMAYRAGCEIINAEYIQFHPTTLYHRDAERFLITESLRGEGARLMNRRGEYFMAHYHPSAQDLAPRDKISRAIYNEMDGAEDFVFLDARDIKVNIIERFPAIFKHCQQLGINIVNELIPVVPSAHYFCGGIKTNSYGATNIKGLYAAGETACTGLHGANRLASMSLLEGLVFGIRAAIHVARHSRRLKADLIDSIPDWVYPKKTREFDPHLIHHDLRNIQTTMWNYVGIVRSTKRLDRALADLNYLAHRIERFYKEAQATVDIIQLRNAILTSTIIARAARSNTVSRGCHFRQD